MEEQLRWDLTATARCKLMEARMESIRIVAKQYSDGHNIELTRQALVAIDAMTREFLG